MGLNIHIQQTCNNNCRIWHREHLPQVDKQYNSDSDSDRNVRNVYLNNNEPPQDFEGDLYGNNYREQDFPGFNDAPHLLADSLDDDRYDAVGNDEDGWEPKPLDQPAGDRDILPPPVGVNPIPLNCHESHNQLSQKPIIWLFNDHPDRNTGAPLENPTKMSYETYQDALLKANAVPNVWGTLCLQN